MADPLRDMLSLVRTLRRVETAVGQQQAGDGLVADDVLFDDLLDVLGPHRLVPDLLGIDHDRGAVLALVEALGLVGPHCSLEASGGERCLERNRDRRGVLRAAAPPRV